MHHCRHIQYFTKDQSFHTSRTLPVSPAYFTAAVRPALVGIGILALGIGLSAQTRQLPSQGDSRPAVQANQPADSASAPKAASLLEEPPTAATINARPDNLSVHAENASLTQTLQRIADKTGMHLEGLSMDQRVFGTFGPGAPRDVINALLDGTGYNVIMIGSLANGAPRQLILSQAKSGGASQAQPQAQPAQQPAPSDDDGSADAPSDDQMPTPPQTFTPPPGSDQAPPPADRTPQQMLQQLQEMRQQQQAPPQ